MNFIVEMSLAQVTTCWLACMLRASGGSCADSQPYYRLSDLFFEVFPDEGPNPYKLTFTQHHLDTLIDALDAYIDQYPEKALIAEDEITGTPIDLLRALDAIQSTNVPGKVHGLDL